MTDWREVRDLHRAEDDFHRHQAEEHERAMAEEHDRQMADDAVGYALRTLGLPGLLTSLVGHLTPKPDLPPAFPDDEPF